MENNVFTIVSDTRDKKEHRWTFEDFADKEFVGVDIKKLDVGDYSILGLEDVFAIERKKSGPIPQQKVSLFTFN